jgi:deazaflavin-dependent oxidoreductase (nitroreductase family)
MSDWNTGIIQEFRDNEGKVGGMFEHLRLLLLTSIGAKTGNTHTSPVAYFKDGDDWLIIASAGGADSHPNWYYNLKANPKARIEIGAETLDALATEVTGDDRDRLYAGVVEQAPQFGEYELNTARKIPMFRLTRI